jgi:hypothetical protein
MDADTRQHKKKILSRLVWRFLFQVTTQDQAYGTQDQQPDPFGCAETAGDSMGVMRMSHTIWLTLNSIVLLLTLCRMNVMISFCDSVGG